MKENGLQFQTGQLETVGLSLSVYLFLKIQDASDFSNSCTGVSFDALKRKKKLSQDVSDTAS